MPNPSNPQNFNRFGYVLNNPVNLIDPTGHICVNNGGTDDEVAMPGNCNGDPDLDYTGGLQGPNWPDPDEEDATGIPDCGYHHCVVETNLYEVGWENFGQAWDIWTNPNATHGQQWLAGAYMSYWTGAHLAFVAGSALFTYAYLAEIIVFGGAPALSADGDPVNEIRVINDLISRSKLVEQATKEWVYQSQGGLGGANRVLESLGLRVENMRAYSTVNGNVFNIALDSGTSVTFRTWSSTLNGLPSTPVLQFANVPGFDVVLRFHFP